MLLTGVTTVLKMRSQNAFKSTCSDKRADELDSSLGFPVIDEKRFILG